MTEIRYCGWLDTTPGATELEAKTKLQEQFLE